MSTRKNVVVLGDSQTDFSVGFGVDGFDNWVAQVQRALIQEGKHVRCRGFGISGDTSAGLLSRISDTFYYAYPDVAIIYIGVNDPGASITTSQTQANIQACIKALKHKAVGDGLGSGSTVADQTALPNNGRLGDRYVVMNDTSTTGGIPALTAVHHTTIGGAVAADANGQKQTVWEYRYSAAGELGWGRVATNVTAPLTDSDGSPLGCTTVIVLSTNYLNFTTGGDTPSTPYSVYQTVRGAQQAAVTAENGHGATVEYADLYTLQKTLIAGGVFNGVTYPAATVPDFSAVAYDQTKSWHYMLNNQHHSAFGHTLVAQAVQDLVAAAI